MAKYPTYVGLDCAAFLEANQIGPVHTEEYRQSTDDYFRERCEVLQAAGLDIFKRHLEINIMRCYGGAGNLVILLDRDVNGGLRLVKKALQLTPLNEFLTER